ncbi:MAG: AMP-binding protein [Deltaproteobacteria bacterium]|nr:AMP-binding protein [Deltaproteobacteria bacterium]
MNLVSLGDEQIEKMGERVSLIFKENEYTNVQIREMSLKLAGGLKSLGISRGDHVVVSLPNSPVIMLLFLYRIRLKFLPALVLSGELERLLCLSCFF